MAKSDDLPKDAYAAAGVNIDAGNALVEAIKPLAKPPAELAQTPLWAGLARCLT